MKLPNLNKEDHEVRATYGMDAASSNDKLDGFKVSSFSDATTYLQCEPCLSGPKS